MRSAIVVHPDFEAYWPFAADYARRYWSRQGDITFVRLEPTDRRPVGAVLDAPETITRLLALGVPVTDACLDVMPALREAAVDGEHASLENRNIRGITQRNEGFWGQSVAEFGLALTLCGLRRIPQLHHAMITDLTPWDYSPVGGVGRPAQRGVQFGDDTRFTNGTIEGKRVRVVGAGNIASRYASFMHLLGADVAAWDPFATDPAFHRAGSRRELFLNRLVQDAEIFAPMVPLLDSTRGIVTAAHIDALPQGCLVVLVTRALICDVPALRRRVLADELALAADVFDIEPVPLNDALLGRSNVVHTPHNAGRTQQANEQWAAALLAQFDPQ